MSEMQPVILKKLTSAHIENFMMWAADPEVTKHMMWDTYTSLNEAKAFFTDIVEKHPWFKAICLGNNVIGSITLEKGSGNYACKAELGYVLAKPYWGKGVATQAVKIAIKAGFKELQIERIEALVDPTNIGSQRVLEKNGFEKEGLLRNYIIQKGRLKSRYLYALLKPL